ncbi:sensor histidine kinase [Microlunatus sp. GCM10028923]|uniref:sensor histidine kinase n=1 Tax=Microlunatus sp. GCM10028923 TaxID=3273400 RepID=UPI00360EA956
MIGSDSVRADSRWEEPLGTLVRLAFVIAIGYAFVASGGLLRSVPTMIAGIVGLVASAGYVLVERFAPVRVRVIILAVALFAGAALCYEIAAIAWVLYGFAAFHLIGRPAIPLRAAVPLVTLAGVVIVAEAALPGPDQREPLWTAGLVIMVGVLGYSRRQRILRRRQERELVERSRQLEERSLEVLAQTERTRVEAARAAALEERNRIAREVHDVLAHSLGGLVVQLDAADALLADGRDPEGAAERVRTSRRLAVEGLREARLAVRELRAGDATAPDAGAADVDLVDRLNALARGPVGIQLGVEFDVVGEPRPVPEPVAAAFAAVCREGLTNINKHAAGSRSVITVIFGDQVRLELINALKPDHDHELAGTGGGLGVPGMRQRIAEIGGTLTAGPRGDRWVVSAEWMEDNA